MKKFFNETLKKYEHLTSWIQLISIILLLIGLWISAYQADDQIDQTEQQIKLTQRQTELMYENNMHLNRAYVSVRTTKKGRFEFLTRGGITKLAENQYFTFNFINDGNTPAYPIYLNYILTNFGLKDFNLRKLIYSSHALDTIFQRNGEGIPHNFTNYANDRFTKTIVKGQPFGLNHQVKNSFRSDASEMYLHIYFLYKDVFGSYHDFYSVQKILIKSDLNLQGLPEIIDMRDVDKDSIPRFVHNY